MTRVFVAVVRSIKSAAAKSTRVVLLENKYQTVIKANASL